MALWAVQAALGWLMVGAYWALYSPAMQALALTQIVTEVLLGLLLIVQLPRALQWRPRRNPRASAELQAERRRIARELHDNIGSQLINIMVLLDPQVPAHSHALRALEQCMLDMRLMVDSMDSGTGLLADRLARLRHRVQPVLDRRGIRMAWDVDPADNADVLDDARAQHLIAIVQEALSNVLQHAQATQVTVRLKYDQDRAQWRLEIQDNGRGLPQDSVAAGATHRGYGLEGMHSRARQMGGALELIRPEGGGTCIRVTLPGGAVPDPMHSVPITPRPRGMAGE